MSVHDREAAGGAAGAVEVDAGDVGEVGDGAAGDRMACFVSPHGLGHAARTAAVLEAVWRLRPGLCIDIYTSAPTWIFEDSLGGPFEIHSMRTDVGLVQRDSLQEDLPATVTALDRFLPLDSHRVARLAADLQARRCRLVIADISPIGLAVAAEAGIPSVLIENFTWDWIYESYIDEEPRLGKFSRQMRALFESATLRIQTEPVCRPLPGAFTVPPVSRRSRRTRAQVRERLEIPSARPAVLLTMGGGHWDYRGLDRLAQSSEATFIVPGGAEEPLVEGSLLLLPHRSGHYHPDLVGSADLVVGKLGYSTLAELYHAGVPFGFVTRPRFPESPVLAGFALRHMPAAEIPAGAFASGTWLERLPTLLEMESGRHGRENGADAIAERLMEWLSRPGAGR